MLDRRSPGRRAGTRGTSLVPEVLDCGVLLQECFELRVQVIVRLRHDSMIAAEAALTDPCGEAERQPVGRDAPHGAPQHDAVRCRSTACGWSVTSAPHVKRRLTRVRSPCDRRRPRRAACACGHRAQAAGGSAACRPSWAESRRRRAPRAFAPEKVPMLMRDVRAPRGRVGLPKHACLRAAGRHAASHDGRHRSASLPSVRRPRARNPLSSEASTAKAGEPASCRRRRQ